MRVLLTGSSGRLGGAFLSLWGEGGSAHEVISLGREQADLALPDELGDILSSVWRQEPFDVLVNPAAMSGLEQCLDAPDEAQNVNVESPRVMAEFCSRVGAQMVHFSTDYVFSGSSEVRPVEKDVSDPVNVYGKTKRAGELAVLSALENALVCRVSWLFGPHGEKSHFDHVMDQSKLSREYIADKYSVPTFTHDIVEWVGVLLDNNASGIYHLCNSGEPESWFSYAQKVLQMAKKNGYLADYQEPQPGSLHNADFFREKRPQCTAMLPKRLLEEGLAKPRSWEKAAEVYLKIR